MVLFVSFVAISPARFGGENFLLASRTTPGTVRMQDARAI